MLINTNDIIMNNVNDNQVYKKIIFLKIQLLYF